MTADGDFRWACDCATVEALERKKLTEAAQAATPKDKQIKGLTQVERILE
jgi:hypothetical protein